MSPPWRSSTLASPSATIHNRAGELVTGAGQLEIPEGLTRLCSSVLVEPAAYGPGRGLADRIYFTGEEVSSPAHPHGGSMWALDVASGQIWAVPGMGRGKWENAPPLDTGDTSHVAFLLSDDSSGSALYLYVGEKHGGGDFLDRNGLRDGQLFVWKSDTGDLSPSSFPSGTRAGTFVPIAVKDAGHAGDPGYDGAGYLDAATLTDAADALGAFSFRRPEDVDANPSHPNQAVFATTGIPTSSDNAGTIYTITVDFADVDNPAADITIAYNANFDPARSIRNPDNLDWSADGFVYVQEDAASAGLFGPGAVNPHEASILRLDPETAAIVRVAAIDRAGAGPFGATDSDPDSCRSVGELRHRRRLGAVRAARRHAVPRRHPGAFDRRWSDRRGRSCHGRPARPDRRAGRRHLAGGQVDPPRRRRQGDRLPLRRHHRRRRRAPTSSAARKAPIGSTVMPATTDCAVGPARTRSSAATETTGSPATPVETT